VKLNYLTDSLYIYFNFNRFD